MHLKARFVCIFNIHCTFYLLDNQSSDPSATDSANMHIRRKLAFRGLRPGPKVLKKIPFSTQLSTKFMLLINVKLNFLNVKFILLRIPTIYFT